MYVEATVLETLDNHSFTTPHFKKHTSTTGFTAEDIRQQPIAGQSPPVILNSRWIAHIIEMV
jgi:hypothetical protein